MTWNGQPVILSAMQGVNSNYPVPAVIAAFNNTAKGSITVENTTVSYSSYAKLISMQTFDPYGGTPGGTPGVVQTWEISSDGSLTGSRKAKVEVVAMGEQPVWPANTYAAFATDPSCGALTFDGNVDINSYDSSNVSGTTQPTFTDAGGNVGTNGNP